MTLARRSMAWAMLGLALALPFPTLAEEPSLVLDTTVLAPGEELIVTFTAPADFPKNAWVGIIPAIVPHGDESENDSHDVSYKYLDGKTEGILEFTAPTIPGEWDVRMHDTDSNGVEVTYESFTVIDIDN